MIKAADVIVIGGGLLGTATALFATKAGASVILLEKGDLAAGASGAAFGGVSASIYSYASTVVPASYVGLSLRSLALYRVLQDEIGPPLDFVQCGSLDPIETAEDRGMFEERAKGLRSSGVPVEVLDSGEVRDIEPAVSGQINGAMYCPIDGHVSPQNAVWAFSKAAQRRGAVIQGGETVLEIMLDGNRTVGVRTNRHEYRSEWVVVSAGLGSKALLAPIGIELPTRYSRGQMFVTERVPPFLNAFLHSIKQTTVGTVVIGATKEPLIDNPATDIEGTHQMMSEATRLIPALSRFRLLRSWVGIRPLPEDGYPILGTVPGVTNMLIAVMHRGVTLAPIVGSLLTDLIVEGSTDLDISSYELERFGQGPGCHRTS